MMHRAIATQSVWMRPLGRIRRPDQIAFKTRWQGALSGATNRQRGLLFSELCQVASLYETCTPFQEKILGFANTAVQCEHGFWSAQFENEWDIVLVFRAPEPHDWVEFVSMQKLRWSAVEGLGRILCGLKEPADAIWPVLESALAKEEKRQVWFCGHSLGGALALIVANRCLISPIHVEPAQMHSFGIPRVGDRRYRLHSRVSHLRWVRDHDPVPQIPPAWSGFWHAGRETRLNLAGRELTLSKWERTMLFWEEIWRTCWARNARLWPLEEHLIDTYIETLWEAVLREEVKAGKR